MATEFLITIKSHEAWHNANEALLLGSWDEVKMSLYMSSAMLSVEIGFLSKPIKIRSTSEYTKCDKFCCKFCETLVYHPILKQGINTYSMPIKVYIPGESQPQRTLTTYHDCFSSDYEKSQIRLRADPRMTVLGIG